METNRSTLIQRLQITYDERKDMKQKKKLIPICISLEKELVEKLDSLADKTGLSRSSFYRQGLIQYHRCNLDNNSADNTDLFATE